jgi:hypothetical protein
MAIRGWTDRAAGWRVAALRDAEWLQAHHRAEPEGRGRQNGGLAEAPYNVYPASDRHIAIIWRDRQALRAGWHSDLALRPGHRDVVKLLDDIRAATDARFPPGVSA